MSAFAFKPSRLMPRRRRDRAGGERAGHRPVLGKRVATAVLLAAMSISVLLSVPGLRPVVRAIGEINPSWVALAVALELASCFSFVVIFRLFFDRIKARDARQLAWTSMASGALLPGGGVGGYAIGGWLAHLTGAPTPWIVRRSSALFFLTSGINSSAVIGAGLLLVAGLRGPHDFGRSALPALLAAAATLVVLALPWIERRRRTPSTALKGIADGIEEAVQAGLHPSWRLAGAPGYLGFDIAVLWVSLTAVGTSLPLPALVLGYSIGYLANSLPVPGGIGVLDAGLAGALLLYGASPVHVVAAVLVYHAIAFWIPSLGGLIAYARLRPRLMAPGNEDGSLMPSSSKIGTPS
jgi:uncharacterized membrane protein YbhN (UPF0104 family)